MERARNGTDAVLEPDLGRRAHCADLSACPTARLEPRAHRALRGPLDPPKRRRRSSDPRRPPRRLRRIPARASRRRAPPDAACRRCARVLDRCTRARARASGACRSRQPRRADPTRIRVRPRRPERARHAGGDARGAAASVRSLVPGPACVESGSRAVRAGRDPRIRAARSHSAPSTSRGRTTTNSTRTRSSFARSSSTVRP